MILVVEIDVLGGVSLFLFLNDVVVHTVSDNIVYLIFWITIVGEDLGDSFEFFVCGGPWRAVSEGSGVDDTMVVFVRAFAGSVEAESRVCGFNEDLRQETVFVAVYQYVEKWELLVFFYLMCKV